MRHSVRLKDEVLVPWSRTQLHHQDDWHGYSFAFPNVFVEPPGLFDEPDFRYARDHLASASPDVLREWLALRSSVDRERGTVKSLKAKVLAEFAAAAGREFGSRVQAVSTFEEARRDVYYEDAVLFIIVTELWEIFHGRRGSPHVELRAESMGAAAYLGSRVVGAGGVEVARLNRMQDAAVEAWQRAFDSTINCQAVRELMSVVAQQDGRAGQDLERFVKALRELIRKIENDVPLEGKCELGF